MSFEFAGYQQRSERFQQELESPMEDVLGATAEQAITESPIVSIFRLNELSRAKDSPQRLDAATARQRLKDAGLEGRLTIPDNGIATPALDILMDRKREEVRRQDILSRAPTGFGSKAQQLGMAFAASALDPVNVGLSFVPAVGQARYLRYLAGAKGILGRTAIRAGVGAVEGAAGAAIIEPLVYAAKTQEQADYDFQDSLLNVAFGTVFGGGLHVLGGAGSEVARALRERRAPIEAGMPRMEPPVNLKDIPDSAAARVDAMPLPEREIAMRTAVAQAMQGKVVDVEPIAMVISPTHEQVAPYHRFTNKGPDNGAGYMMFSDDADRVSHYGRNHYTFDPADIDPSRIVDADSADLQSALVSALDRHPEKLNEYQASAEALAKDANPSDIVDGAGFWDAPDLVEIAWNEVLEPNNWTAVKTANGIVVFDPDVVRRVPDQEDAEISLADARAAADRQVSPESEVTADVPAAQAADSQLAEMPPVKDPIAEQEALLADELEQLKEAARVAGVDLGDELAEFDEVLKLADEYGTAARAAVICGMAH